MQSIVLKVGRLEANCYLIFSDEQRMLIIDPGDDALYISDKISQTKSNPTAILLTHGHFDHMMAAGELSLIYNIPVFLSDADKFITERIESTVQRFLGHNFNGIKPLVYSDFNIKNRSCDFMGFLMSAIETPGHTPGSLSFYFPDSKSVYSGDLIFENGSIGRTDFGYSNPILMSESLKIILNLPDDVIIYPGHGNKTNVKAEKIYHKV